MKRLVRLAGSRLAAIGAVLGLLLVAGSSRGAERDTPPGARPKPESYEAYEQKLADEKHRIEAATVKLESDPVVVTAWRAYAAKGGGAELKRFALVWASTRGLRAGYVGQSAGMAPVGGKAGATGEAWAPIFDLDCAAASEERRSSGAGNPYVTAMRSRELPSVQAGPLLPVRLHVDLILGLYCRDSCRFPEPLTSIDSGELIGRYESRNLEWTDSNAMRWSRATGAYSYSSGTRYVIQPARDHNHSEQGTCRLASFTPPPEAR